MAVKSKRYRDLLEKETRKKQPLRKAELKAAVMAGAYGEKVNKYHRQSWSDKIILKGLRKLHRKPKKD